MKDSVMKQKIDFSQMQTPDVNSDTELSRQLVEFEQICDQLCTVIDEENDRFMISAFVENAARSAKKVSLLDVFETQSDVIAHLLQYESQQDLELHRHFVGLVEKLQYKLRINTSWYIHMMAEQVGHVAQNAAKDKTKMTRKFQRGFFGRKAGELCH